MIRNALELGRQLSELRLGGAVLRRKVARRLRVVVRHAQRNVPFYRERFDDAGVDPREIRSPRDLPRLPATTKRELRQAGIERIVAAGTDLGACNRLLTSGATAEPFAVYLSAAELRSRLMTYARPFFALGMRPTDRLAVLGPVAWPEPSVAQRWGVYRRKNVSPMWPLGDQLGALREFRPTILWAYPTALQTLLDNGGGRLRETCPLRMLVTSAEAPRGAPGSLGERLGCEQFNFYGAMETGRIAWECRAHRGLHVNVGHVIVEIENCGEAAGPGCGPGEVLVTTLDARTMPFIRYRLGDLASPIDGACPCGSPLPLISAPLGRSYDLMRLPSGRTQTPLGLMFVLRETPGLTKYRIVQEAPDRLIVELVMAAAESERRLGPLRDRLAACLAEAIRVELRPTAAIEGPRSKTETFVSRLAEER